MKRPSRDQEREQRITMEIVVDAYTPEEHSTFAVGWLSRWPEGLSVTDRVKCCLP
jgi:hypothetical protein